MEKNINVVIVDSDINYRKIYMDCVKSLGAEVSLSTSEPMRSLDFIVEKHPKILIMDIVLPGYDSLEYISTIREVSPDTNIIVITHFINDYIEKMCMDLGVVRYLHKTVQSDIISFVISQQIGFDHIKKNCRKLSDSVSEINDALINHLLLYEDDKTKEMVNFIKNQFKEKIEPEKEEIFCFSDSFCLFDFSPSF